MRRRLLAALLASSGLAACVETGYIGIVRAEQVTFTPPIPSTIVVGDTLRLTAVARKRNGNPMTRRVGFSSSDARRATISNVGLVKGVSPGTVRITASSDGKSAHLQLVVQRAPSFP
jgi:uncharacterized protein YjdB